MIEDDIDQSMALAGAALNAMILLRLEDFCSAAKRPRSRTRTDLQP